jgi:Protein of unknown function (DUF4232)
MTTHLDDEIRTAFAELAATTTIARDAEFGDMPSRPGEPGGPRRWTVLTAAAACLVVVGGLAVAFAARGRSSERPAPATFPTPVSTGPSTTLAPVTNTAAPVGTTVVGSPTTLPGASSTVTTAGALPSTSAAAPVVAETESTVAATSSATTAVLGERCAAADLTMSLGESDGGAGRRYQPIVVTNVGSRTCTVQGFPEVRLVDASGAQIGEPAQPESTTPPAIVALAPGDIGSILLQTLSGPIDGPCSPASAAVLVLLPGDTDEVALASEYIACTGFTVRAFVSGPTGL